MPTLNLFEGCKMFMSLRSPFARRVRLAFLEHNLIYDEQQIDVFNPPAEYINLNPLMRVPVVVLKSGKSIVDSNSILQLFYEGQLQSPLRQKTDEDKVLVANWSGVALGIAEFAVQYFLETLRDKMKSHEALTEYENNLKNGVREFSQYLGKREYIATTLSQADLDMGTALGYLSIRHSWDWKVSYPNVAEYFWRLENRPSFIKTKPLPP